MTTPKIHLDVSDAVEIAEALTFVADWLRHDRQRLEASLHDFVGVTGYDINTLHTDLARLAFLLGDDGDRLFGDHES